MSVARRKTRTVNVGGIKVGSDFRVSIQSMLKADLDNIDGVICQIRELKEAGCDIVRLAVKDKKSANVISKIKSQVCTPLVADIHFDYRLAIEAIVSGADKIRLNPGNIREEWKVKEVVICAKEHRVPIRIGVNSGSIRERKDLVETALDYVKMLESFGFYDIIISMKSSSVIKTIDAYRRMARLCDYPFHLGVTAAGLDEEGIVKSTLGIGVLLSEGIGDTIRVSLTAEPIKEVYVAKEILRSLNIIDSGLELVSCPTCSRCQVELVEIVEDISAGLMKYRSQNFTTGKRFKIAVMGCEVNGPGEAKDADVGIAAGRRSGILFKKGKIIKKVDERDFAKVILDEVDSMLNPHT